MNAAPDSTSTGTPELRPCPFCGETRISLNAPNKFHNLGSINCPACMVVMPGATSDENELIGCWNGRADILSNAQTVRGPSEPLQCLRCGTIDAFGPVSKTNTSNG